MATTLVPRRPPPNRRAEEEQGSDSDDDLPLMGPPRLERQMTALPIGHPLLGPPRLRRTQSMRLPPRRLGMPLGSVVYDDDEVPMTPGGFGGGGGGGGDDGSMPKPPPLMRRATTTAAAAAPPPPVPPPRPRLFTAGTLNVGAMQVNPHEFDPSTATSGHSKLVITVNGIIKSGADDVLISTLFPFALVQALAKCCRTAGYTPHDVQRMVDYYNHYLVRLLVFRGFFGDKDRGKQRQVSWPDRVTNHIPCYGGFSFDRPCVTTHFTDFDATDAVPGAEGIDQWFNRKWLPAMFMQGLPPTNEPAVYRIKGYPARYKVEPIIQKGGVPIQLLLLAIHDAGLLYACGRAMPGTWPAVHKAAVARIRDRDHRVTLAVKDLASTTDVLCLQECSARHAAAFMKTLPSKRVVVGLGLDQTRDQNSFIIYDPAKFRMGRDVTDAIEKNLPPDHGVQPGELLAVQLLHIATGRFFYVVSFHNDMPSAKAVAAGAADWVARHDTEAGLVVGMDANTSQGDYPAFAGSLLQHQGLMPSWFARDNGVGRPVPTTNNVRSAMQAQYHKVGEHNHHPKDFLLCSRHHLSPLTAKVVRGSKSGKDVPMPNGDWPFDHAAQVTVFEAAKRP